MISIFGAKMHATVHATEAGIRWASVQLLRDCFETGVPSLSNKIHLIQACLRRLADRQPYRKRQSRLFYALTTA